MAVEVVTAGVPLLSVAPAVLVGVHLMTSLVGLQQPIKVTLAVEDSMTVVGVEAAAAARVKLV
tara:strand:+ start:789 stop:977 length:189 start_codon:yes stop_codon:yes gene_type:complete